MTGSLSDLLGLLGFAGMERDPVGSSRIRWDPVGCSHWRRSYLRCTEASHLGYAHARCEEHGEDVQCIQGGAKDGEGAWRIRVGGGDLSVGGGDLCLGGGDLCLGGGDLSLGGGDLSVG